MAIVKLSPWIFHLFLCDQNTWFMEFALWAGGWELFFMKSSVLNTLKEGSLTPIDLKTPRMPVRSCSITPAPRLLPSVFSPTLAPIGYYFSALVLQLPLRVFP